MNHELELERPRGLGDCFTSGLDLFRMHWQALVPALLLLSYPLTWLMQWASFGMQVDPEVIAADPAAIFSGSSLFSYLLLLLLGLLSHAIVLSAVCVLLQLHAAPGQVRFATLFHGLLGRLTGNTLSLLALAILQGLLALVSLGLLALSVFLLAGLLDAIPFVGAVLATALSLLIFPLWAALFLPAFLLMPLLRMWDEESITDSVLLGLRLSLRRPLRGMLLLAACFLLSGVIHLLLGFPTYLDMLSNWLSGTMDSALAAPYRPEGWQRFYLLLASPLTVLANALVWLPFALHLRSLRAENPEL